jgi:RNA polymerase sigma factor (sigma-70 family)
MEGKHSWAVLSQKVAEAQMGSAQALDDVFRFLRTRLLMTAKHRLPEAAEDVVQDSLIVVHKHFSEIGNLEGLVAFCNRVLRNKIGNAYKSHERRSKRLGLEEISRADHSVTDDLEGAEMDRILREAIEKLGGRRPDCKAIFLYLYDGFSATEISDRVSVSKAVLKARTWRCRAALRDVLMSEYNLPLGQWSPESCEGRYGTEVCPSPKGGRCPGGMLPSGAHALEGGLSCKNDWLCESMIGPPLI